MCLLQAATLNVSIAFQRLFWIAHNIREFFLGCILAQGDPLGPGFFCLKIPLMFFFSCVGSDAFELSKALKPFEQTATTINLEWNRSKSVVHDARWPYLPPHPPEKAFAAPNCRSLRLVALETFNCSIPVC